MRKQVVTVDIIIRYKGGIVIVKRKNPPFGWALPGGVVEVDETLEHAAVREAKEETGLDIRLEKQLYTYSDPSRDERWHAITTVFIADVVGGEIKAGDDAEDVKVVPLEKVPKLEFDHNKILIDYENDF
ncbi:MAG: NUDIX hydrolase [Candidatus Woesearchaeota archaeon]